MTSCHIPGESRQVNYSPPLCSSLEPCLDWPSLCWTVWAQLFLSGNCFTFRRSLLISLGSSPVRPSILHSQDCSQAFPPTVWSRRNFSCLLWLVRLFTHPSVVFAFVLFCNSVTQSPIECVIDYSTPAASSEDPEHFPDEPNPSLQSGSLILSGSSRLGDNSALLASDLAGCTRDVPVSSHLCVPAQLPRT